MADRYNEEIQTLEALMSELTGLLQSQERMMNEYRAFANDFMSLIKSSPYLENDYRIFAAAHEGAPAIPETEPEMELEAQEEQRSPDNENITEEETLPAETVTALYMENGNEPVQIELSVDQLINDSNDYNMIRSHSDNTAILYRKNDQDDLETGEIGSILSADIRNIYNALNGDVYIIGLGNGSDEYISLTPDEISYYETVLKKDEAIKNNEPAEDIAESETKEQKPEKITCLLVKPGLYPQQITIDNTLENLQHAVGGLIEEFYFDAEDAVIVCNEEGKINGLDLNRSVRDDYGNISEIIAGDFLVVGTTYDNFGSLTQEQMDKYEKMFHQPETFYEVNGNIYAEPIPDETVKLQSENKNAEDKSKIHVEYGLCDHEEGKPYEVYMSAVVKYDDGSETPLYASRELDTEFQEKSFEHLRNEIERQAVVVTDLDGLNRLDFNCFKMIDISGKKKTDTPEQLAYDLDQFASEYDHYEYMDAYDGGSSIDKNIDLLENGDTAGIIDWLNEVLENDPNLPEAMDLLERVEALTQIKHAETEPQKEESIRKTPNHDELKPSILDKEAFEYNGYHFKPVGIADDPSNVADIEFISPNYKGDHIDYNMDEFYKNSGVPTALNTDVFYCFEFNNYYYADKDCLVEYYGEINPIVSEDERGKTDTPEEVKAKEPLESNPLRDEETPSNTNTEGSEEQQQTEEQAEDKYHVTYGMLDNPIFGKDVVYMSATVRDAEGKDTEVRMQIALDHDNPEQSYDYLRNNFADLAQKSAYITPDQLEFDDFRDFDSSKTKPEPETGEQEPEYDKEPESNKVI